MTTERAVVLGCGLMGRLLACELARVGFAVEVFDASAADAPASAAHVAAAMLAPLAESAVTELGVVRMGCYSLARWPELIAALDVPVFFQNEGTLVLWHRQDAAEAARFQQQLAATAHRVPELAAMQTLAACGIAELEPAIGERFAQGLYLPGEGQLDNRELLSALLQRMLALQVSVHWNSPRAAADFDGYVTGSDWLFDCRGLGARNEWPALRGVRGEVVRVHAPEVALSRPTRLLHPRYPLYIAPKPGGVFVIGATEIESDDTSPASVRSTLELLSAAYTVHPAFAEARVLELGAQCRPTLRDNLPALRWLGPRRLQINGLYRHGFLIAPAMLDVVICSTSTRAAARWPNASRCGLTLRLREPMKVHINNIAHELAAGATLADAISQLQPKPPFAAAVNMQFVPNTRYEETVLQSGDRIDLIAPVTGG